VSTRSSCSSSRSCGCPGREQHHRPEGAFRTEKSSLACLKAKAAGAKPSLIQYHSLPAQRGNFSESERSGNCAGFWFFGLLVFFVCLFVLFFFFLFNLLVKHSGPQSTCQSSTYSLYFSSITTSSFITNYLLSRITEGRIKDLLLQ